MINLEHLTEEERKIILDVLKRDDELRQAEEERVKKLKNELYELRRKSAIKVDDEDAAAASSNKVCARCREPLGAFINSGEVCPKCQQKVCTNCKVVLPMTKKWLCTICNKQLQIRLESGDAFGPMKEGQAELYGTDLVKASLQKSKLGQDPDVIITSAPLQISPSDSGYNGRIANASSMGESGDLSGGYEDDEDYTSDNSYQQSTLSGVESIGPSVSQRGSVSHQHGLDDHSATRYDSSTPSSPWLSPHVPRRRAPPGVDDTSTPPASETEDGRGRHYRKKRGPRGGEREGSDRGSTPSSQANSAASSPSSSRARGPYHSSPDRSLVASTQGSGQRQGKRDDVTLQRIPSQSLYSDEADPQKKDMCNASHSGIESVHDRYTKNKAEEANMLSARTGPSSPAVKETLVQSLKTQRHPPDSHPRSPAADFDRHNKRGSQIGLEDKGKSIFTHLRQTSPYSSKTEPPPRLESLPSPPLRVRANPSVFSPTLRTSSTYTPLTHQHAQHYMLGPSKHLTNSLYTSTPAMSTANRPTSNLREFDTHSFGNTPIQTKAGHAHHVIEMGDNMDEEGNEKLSDTAGEDSSRQSDTDAMSITSSSTVAWDAVADGKEQNGSGDLEKEGLTNDNLHIQTAGLGYEDNCILSKDILQQQQNINLVAGSVFESTTSSVRDSNLYKPTDGGFCLNNNVNQFVLNQQESLVLPTSNSELYNSFIPQDSSDTSNPEKFIVLDRGSDSFESDGSDSTMAVSVGDVRLDKFLSENGDKGMPVTGITFSGKRLSMSDILLLQRHGAVLRNFRPNRFNSSQSSGGETEASMEEKQTLSDPTEHRTDVGPQDSDMSLVKRTGKDNRGSMEGGDLLSEGKAAAEEDESDCSSLDLAELHLSEVSDSDDDDSRCPVGDLLVSSPQDGGKTILGYGSNLSPSDGELTEEKVKDSITEWGVHDNEEGLVPLVLPGRAKEMKQIHESEDMQEREKPDSEQRSFLPNFLKRLVGKPEEKSNVEKTVVQPQLDFHSSKLDASSSSSSVEISSDSDSYEETCLHLDASHLAYTSEEKEALYKTKLEYNQALMKSLLKDVPPQESVPLTASETQHLDCRNDQERESVESGPGKSPHQSKRDDRGERTKRLSKKRSSGRNPEASDDGANAPHRRRKKRGKGKSRSDIWSTSEKAAVKHSRTQFGVLSSSADGKSQCYTFGGERDDTSSPVELSKGTYKMKPTSSQGSPAADRHRTPFIALAPPQPQIYRKQPSRADAAGYDSSSSSSCSSSSSGEEDNDDEEEEDVEDQRQEMESHGDRRSYGRGGVKHLSARRSSWHVHPSSDSELSVILELPEDGDSDIEASNARRLSLEWQM
ncbi:uncharacterized protein [Diadema setosum]|uniref:uncharacterized protein n=1 Tax=Diadema setosum TaxID=31175 RepID=UPI003B3B02DD